LIDTATLSGNGKGSRIRLDNKEFFKEEGASLFNALQIGLAKGDSLLSAITIGDQNVLAVFNGSSGRFYAVDPVSGKVLQEFDLKNTDNSRFREFSSQLEVIEIEDGLNLLLLKDSVGEVGAVFII